MYWKSSGGTVGTLNVPYDFSVKNTLAEFLSCLIHVVEKQDYL